MTNDPTQRIEVTTTPEGAKGWESVQARHNDTAGGHGLDVAPDAQPEGVRAEIRRLDDRAGGEPSNAPTAASAVSTPYDAEWLEYDDATRPVSDIEATKCGAGRGSDTTGAGARNTRPTTLAEGESALRAKAAATTNPAYQQRLLKFLRLMDWVRSC